jgi:hypothetical protein
MLTNSLRHGLVTADRGISRNDTNSFRPEQIMLWSCRLQSEIHCHQRK